MGFLENVFKRNSELEWMFDLEFTYDVSEKAYIKKIALETCINFIARSISQSDFRIVEGTQRIKDDWHYLLNVRPNTDQSAADFWQSFVHKLIYDNEVLVVLTDDNDLLIADSFYRKEFAIYPDVFSDVTVKDFTFQRSFQMDEVIHISYNNEKLTDFMSEMFKDYADLFSRMLEVNKRNNQIRGTVDIDATQDLKSEQQNKLQKYIDKLYAAFKNNAVAIVPQLKGFKYSEVSNGSVSAQSTEGLEKLQRATTDNVAKILGIPTALVHGEMADLDKSMQAYIKFCLGPLLKKIKDEMNAKLIDKDDFLKKERRIEIFGVTHKDVIGNAEAVDKLVASGAFTRNEVRELFGAERSDNKELDEFVITKNYQSASTVEGGEKK